MPKSRIRTWWRFRISTLLIAFAVAGLCFSYLFVRQPLSLDNLSGLRQRARIDVDAWKIVWNGRGDRVAIVGWEKPVQIHDAVTLWKTRTIGEGKKIIHFSFSPDQDIVAYCENGGQPSILNIATGKTLVIDIEGGQHKLSFSPDGKLLASGTYGTRAFVWDVVTGEAVHELNVGPTKGGLSPLFSPDGSIIAVGHRNSKTHLFDSQSGKLLHVLPESMSQELRFHPTLPILAVAYVDGSIRLWDYRNGELLQEVQTTADEIYTLDWSRDGKILASAGRNGDIDLWKGEDLSLVHTLSAPPWVISVRFRPDMRGLFVGGGEPTTGSKRFVQELVVPSLTQRLFWDDASQQ